MPVCLFRGGCVHAVYCEAVKCRGCRGSWFGVLLLSGFRMFLDCSSNSLPNSTLATQLTLFPPIVSEYSVQLYAPTNAETGYPVILPFAWVVITCIKCNKEKITNVTVALLSPFTSLHKLTHNALQPVIFFVVKQEMHQYHILQVQGNRW